MPVVIQEAMWWVVMQTEAPGKVLGVAEPNATLDAGCFIGDNIWRESRATGGGAIWSL
jgi:hypothetical protein